jgi:hypothetical protein
MQLTARQVELLNSTNPQDNAELLASLGGDQQLLHQLVNMYGPGGSQFNATNYGQTAGNVAQNVSGIPESIKQIYIQQGILDPSGTKFLKHQDNDGNWVAGGPGGSYSAATVDPSQSWSGTNAQGGFTGGTGVGVTSGAFNSQTGAPLTAAQLYAALNPTRPSNAGGPNPTQPANPRTGGNFPSTNTGGLTPTNPTNTPTAVGAPGTGGTGVGGTTPVGGGTTTPGTGTTTPGSGTGTPGTGTTTPTTPAAGAAVNGDPMAYFDDAGYKFRLKEGTDAINNTAAARGNALSGPAAKRAMGYASDLASQEYGNAFNRMTNARDYSEGVRRYDTSLGENQRQFNAGFGENQRQFDEGTRRWGLNYDYNTATGDRDFNEGVRRFDLTTNLGQANTDRNFSYGTLKDLATLGLGASNGAGGLSQTLAQLLTGGTLAGGGALAGGTIGGANAGNNLASQLLSLIFGNNLVNNIKP